MLYLLGVVLVALVLVSIARAILVTDSRPLIRNWGPLTIAGLALGGAFVLYLPSVDRAVDPAVHDAVGVANISDITHILLTLIVWWALGMAALLALRRGGEKAWTAACQLCAAAAVVAFAVADLRKTEVIDMLELRDVGTMALALMYTLWALVGGALVVTTALVGLRTPDARRPGLFAVLVASFCGVGYAVTAAVVVAVGGVETLRENAEIAMTTWAIPGLSALAIGGSVAVARSALHRSAN